MTLRSITASILTTLSIHSGQAADDFVIQTDLETGLTQHIYVSGPDSIGHKSGVVGSALPVGPAGSVFRLYGVGLAPDTKLYLLDETVVGSFMPEATVSVTSEDPYTVVTRTRADEKFNAKLTFKKLLDDEDAPEAARKVDVERLVEAFYVTKNGSINTQFNTSLASTLPFKQRGEGRGLHR